MARKMWFCLANIYSLIYMAIILAVRLQVGCCHKRGPNSERGNTNKTGTFHALSPNIGKQ